MEYRPGRLHRWPHERGARKCGVPGPVLLPTWCHRAVDRQGVDVGVVSTARGPECQGPARPLRWRTAAGHPRRYYVRRPGGRVGRRDSGVATRDPMSVRILVAHADGEAAVAAQLAEPLRQAGYDVVYQGSLLVGDSLAAEASAVL